MTVPGQVFPASKECSSYHFTLCLRELAFEVAFEGNRLGSSMPSSPISIPGSTGGTSDILIGSHISSSELNSSSEPTGLTKFSSSCAVAILVFDGPA